MMPTFQIYDTITESDLLIFKQVYDTITEDDLQVYDTITDSDLPILNFYDTI